MNAEDISTNFLTREHYLIVNKTLATAIGLKEAVVLSDLISKYNYFKAANRLSAEGWFFNTYDNIADDTALSIRQVADCSNTLVNLGILESALHGVPPKKHWKINFEAIISKYFPNSTKSAELILQKAQNQFSENRRNINTNNITLKINENYLAVYEAWNQAGVIVHKAFTEKMKRKIAQAVQAHTQEGVLKAISNYAQVLKAPDKYFFSYRWTLADFLQRGLERFLDEARPLENFLKTGFRQPARPIRDENYYKGA